MKKFIIRIVFITILAVGIVMGLVLKKMAGVYSTIDEVYAIDPHQDVLALGSSQIGCSIVESIGFHNKVLWVSQTLPNSSLMRLKELEKRGELQNVKMLIVYFNEHIYRLFNAENKLLAMRNEFPLAWHYTNLFQMTKTMMISDFIENLKFPLDIKLSETPPVNRPSVSKKSLRDFATFTNHVKDIALHCDCNEAAVKDDEVVSVYMDMKLLCDAHDIRFVIVDYPAYPRFVDNIPISTKSRVDAVFARFEKSGIDVHHSKRYPESYYCDYVHMTDSGAMVFTKDLYEALKLDAEGALAK